MPTLHINLAKIEHNTRLIADMLRRHGVRLVGVTKACQGNERVAGAMLAGGAAALADSRATSIDNLRAHFPNAELELMRPVIEAGNLSAAADIFFVSTEAQARTMMQLFPARPIRFCLMVEAGDGREGAPLSVATREAACIASLAGAELAGLATTLACVRPQAPLAGAMEAFSRAVAETDGLFEETDRASDSRAPLVSVGGSGLLALFDERGARPGLPGGRPSPLGTATELRSGEAILLGSLPSDRDGLFLSGAHSDAFRIEAPVLEAFEAGGGIRAVAGIGIQDVGLGRIIPAGEGIEPVGITSDYLILQCPAAAKEYCAAGASVSFIPTYYSLLAAMTSPYVEKIFH